MHFFVNYGNFSPENHRNFRKHNKNKKNKNNKKQGRIIWFYSLICGIINYKLIGVLPSDWDKINKG